MNATVEISNNCDDCWVPSQELCEHWLDIGLQVAGRAQASSISLSFVEPEISQSLNKAYRGKDKPTNVLSFPAEFPEELRGQIDGYPLGDIVICAAVVQVEALDQRKNLSEHWAHLTIHGLLHLLGYEHEAEEQAKDMESLEIEALERLGITNPYLIV